MAKKFRRIKDTSKTYPKVSGKKVAKALGARPVREIDWKGNPGRSTPSVGKKKEVVCGVCGQQMDVKPNQLGPTSFAESMAGGRHNYDEFTCPALEKDWHKRILRLKDDLYREYLDFDDPIGYEKKKKAAEKEILELLEANTQ